MAENKGIRPFANAMFIATAMVREPTDNRKANAAFRANINCAIMEQFGATLAAAATAYNNAFINARALVAAGNEELGKRLVGLGRAEDKKGGRKSNAEKAVLAKGGHNEVPGLEALLAELDAIVIPELLDPMPTAQTMFRVLRKKDGSEVAAELDWDAAQAMIATAAKKKQAKLYWM